MGASAHHRTPAGRSPAHGQLTRRGRGSGFDPWLISEEGTGAIHPKSGFGHDARRSPNPIDAVWRDRPPAPQAPAMPHALEDFAGRSADEKRQDIAAALREG